MNISTTTNIFELREVADHDETLAPLTNSTMKVYEKFVEKSTSSVEDIFEDDIERDRDPDYVQQREI